MELKVGDEVTIRAEVVKIDDVMVHVRTPNNWVCYVKVDDLEILSSNDKESSNAVTIDVIEDRVNALEDRVKALEDEHRKIVPTEEDDADGEEIQSNTVMIGTLEPGLTVKVGGIEVDILDMDVKDIAGDRGVLVLAHDVLFQKAFDEDNCNNWTKSSLRKYLNGEWLDNLKKSVPGENILSFKRDLTSDDGLDDYGTCADIISMISCEEYRKYRKHISNKSDWWWTLTAYSTPSSGNSYSVRYVYADGSLYNSDAYYGSRGVAPAFLLLPDTLVEIA